MFPKSIKVWSCRIAKTCSKSLSLSSFILSGKKKKNVKKKKQSAEAIQPKEVSNKKGASTAVLIAFLRTMERGLYRTHDSFVSQAQQLKTSLKLGEAVDTLAIQIGKM